MALPETLTLHFDNDGTRCCTVKRCHADQLVLGFEVQENVSALLLVYRCIDDPPRMRCSLSRNALVEW